MADDRDLPGDEAQRALSEAMRRTLATVPDPTPAELIAFVREEYDEAVAEQLDIRASYFTAILALLVGRTGRDGGLVRLREAAEALRVAQIRAFDGIPTFAGRCADENNELHAAIAALLTGLERQQTDEQHAPSSVATGAGPDESWERHTSADIARYQRCEDYAGGAYHYDCTDDTLCERCSTLAREIEMALLSSAPVPLPDAAPSPWRSTDVEMPADHERVLCWYPITGAAFIGSHDGGWFYGPGGEEPSHWMPIPTLPLPPSASSPAKEPVDG